MPIPAGFEDVGVNPAAIVADHNAQSFGTIFQFDLDLLRARMPERVDERFPADSINLIPEQRMQGPAFAVDDDAKVNVLAHVLSGDQSC